MLRASRSLHNAITGYMPMSAATIDIIKATAPAVAPKARDITDKFYPLLFKNNPEALTFFNKTNQKKGMQADALAKAVIAYASNIDNLGALGPAVEKIAHRHCALAVTPELYGIVHKNLMQAIGEVLGDAVTPEVGEGWSNAVMALAEICTNAEEELYQKMEARQGGWRGMKDFEVTKITQVAQDTVQFDFTPKDGTSTGIAFSPGQYLTIRLPSSDIIAPRHYTVTSKGDGSVAGLQCTTRHVQGREGTPDGAVSSYMHKTMQVGETVQLSAPCGVYTPEKLIAEGAKVAFVTAGIGATPAAAWAQSGQVEVVGGVHCDRSADYDGFSKLLGSTPVYGGSFQEDAAAVSSLGGKLGGDVNYLVCGPPGFMRNATQALKDSGCTKIHTEAFGTGDSVK